MKVLCACEESQRVCLSFRELGHEAFSADILEPSGGHPEWHILGDVTPIINGGSFHTMDGTYYQIGTGGGGWDMIIAFPPCTYMTNASAVRMRVKGEIQPERWRKAMEAKEFFLRFWNANCPRIAIENPIPLKSIELPPYTQIIQPYNFGHPYSKKTCLWLKGLPPLFSTEVMWHHEPWVNGGCKDHNGNYRRYQGRKERDPLNRSKTFWGIARAMAATWGTL